MNRPTFEELTRREPRLAESYDQASEVNPAGCTSVIWSWVFKPRLDRLVGWYRPDDDPVLSSCEARDMAHRIIYTALESRPESGETGLGPIRWSHDDRHSLLPGKKDRYPSV